MKKILNEDLKRLSVEEFKTSTKNQIVVLLDNVRSRNNVGSVFRTADSFLINEIILGGITPIPPHRDIYKTALGSTESVVWQHEENLENSIKNLKQEGYKIFAIEQVEGSISLEKFEMKNEAKVAVIFGSEIGGVNQSLINLCDGSLEIPQFGTKHSLNISVSCGIVLWQLISKIIE